MGGEQLEHVLGSLSPRGEVQRDETWLQQLSQGATHLKKGLGNWDVSSYQTPHIQGDDGHQIFFLWCMKRKKKNLS